MNGVIGFVLGALFVCALGLMRRWLLDAMVPHAAQEAPDLLGAESLLDLPITRACAEKWHRGRLKFRGAFQGNPLEELFSELVDGVNYADQALLEGFDMEHIRETLINLAEDVREMAADSTTAKELTTEQPAPGAEGGK